MRAVAIVSKGKANGTYQCLLCDEPIAVGSEVARIKWAPNPVAGFGYFHSPGCSDAMIRGLSETHEIAQSEVA